MCKRTVVSSLDKFQRWELRNDDATYSPYGKTRSIWLKYVTPIVIQKSTGSLWAMIRGCKHDAAPTDTVVREHRFRYVRFFKRDRLHPFKFADDLTPYEESLYLLMDGSVIKAYDPTYPPRRYTWLDATLDWLRRNRIHIDKLNFRK